jgi:hypothetical protein
MSQIHRKLENWEREQLPHLLEEAETETNNASALDGEAGKSTAVDAIIRIAVSSAERALRVKRRMVDVSIRKPMRHTESAFEQRIVGLFAE